MKSIKGFALKNGDLCIENNEIKMINGEELKRQSIESVLNTNKGEWSLNIDEGINFSNILGKKRSGISDEDADRQLISEIQGGINQVDDSLVVESFNISHNAKSRKVTVNFTASNGTSDTITASVNY